jgi:hypothetical protein
MSRNGCGSPIPRAQLRRIRSNRHAAFRSVQDPRRDHHYSLVLSLDAGCLEEDSAPKALGRYMKWLNNDMLAPEPKDRS